MSSAAIRPTRSVLPLLQRALDTLVICVALPWVHSLTSQAPANETLTFGLMASLMMALMGEALGVYRPSRGRSADSEVVLITAAWTLSVVGMAMVVWTGLSLDGYATAIWLLWYLLAGLGLLCVHMVMRSILELAAWSGVMVRRTAIVGWNALALEIARNAHASADCGMKVVGIFDDREKKRGANAIDPSVPMLGSSSDLIHAIQRGDVDTVLIALPMRAEKRIQSLLDGLANSTVSVYLVPDFFVFELLHARWTHVGSLPVVSVFETPIYGVDGWLKRTLDVVLSLLALVFSAPILLVCALAVKWTSPGPIFFRQRRYGLDGREILVWKFRTMTTCENGAVVTQAIKDDPRVTPVGRILRRTSLDELPQLFNVITGSMSLVGPRPHATAHNEYYRSLIRGYMMRHKVKPGITGLAQVIGSRGETETLEKMEQRVALDHRYIREWSLTLDLKILFQTVGVVLRQDAY